jgi:hypothetical protein
LKTKCPYCQSVIDSRSKDHIFPKFLGGRRKISSCKSCNDYFGYSFEAIAAKSLQPLHVFISSGVPLKSARPFWKAGHEQSGQKLDFSVGDNGMVAHLSKPMVELREDGTLLKGQFRDVKEANRVLADLRRKGDLRPNARIVQVEIPTHQLADIAIDVRIGPELRRLALKMAISASTLLPNFELAEVHEARLYLMGNPNMVHVNNVLVDIVNMGRIDDLRPPLSHVIYVERFEGRVWATIQFFGSIQLFCNVGVSSLGVQNAAVLGFLDPVTGDEKFSEQCTVGLALPGPLLGAESIGKSFWNVDRQNPKSK